MIWLGMYEDVCRVDLLKAAREKHPLRLLECVLCGWSWLTMETAKVSNFMEDGYQVTCADEHDCLRRYRDRVARRARYFSVWVRRRSCLTEAVDVDFSGMDSTRWR